ncbi:MAG: hypothetical protein GY870_02705, partial [archaeon]|nr:hypothetical protein [archaeon]
MKRVYYQMKNNPHNYKLYTRSGALQQYKKALRVIHEIDFECDSEEEARVLFFDKYDNDNYEIFNICNLVIEKKEPEDKHDKLNRIVQLATKKHI